MDPVKYDKKIYIVDFGFNSGNKTKFNQILLVLQTADKISNKISWQTENKWHFMWSK